MAGQGGRSLGMEEPPGRDVVGEGRGPPGTEVPGRDEGCRGGHLRQGWWNRHGWRSPGVGPLGWSRRGGRWGHEGDEAAKVST